MALTFRQADDGDIELLVEFMRHQYAEDHTRFDESFARTSLEELIASDRLGSVYLIQQDDAPCGYLAVTPGFSLRLHGRIAIVDELFVVPPHRGHDIEQAALRFVCDLCTQMGMDAVNIMLTSAEEVTARLARALGFRQSGRTLLTKWLA